MGRWHATRRTPAQRSTLSQHRDRPGDTRPLTPGEVQRWGRHDGRAGSPDTWVLATRERLGYLGAVALESDNQVAGAPIF
jgi:hypothetical protein